ncbi:hypothetical protein [Sulfitobacter sp. 20_GPM-1509m]|uniref:hypothetical protein n=1 Tax=Sulfitobacter sp. 20_GPM-1509m TaxID=1380367 RepID=UPI00068440B5|nr:hypothetical protein [Sulfitobacter sp. 20_GPM-1509m]
MIAALYVQTGGCYFGIPDIDPWDEGRDARMYGGPDVVIAHPPCQRWGRMWKGQPGNIKAGKSERKGDDGGCFKSALFDVRRWGGVLEHPEGSHAWAHFGLNKPPREGGWVRAGGDGGWCCRVEQGQYGHYCPKPTWLLVYGVAPEDLPELRWGVNPVRDEDFPPDVVARHGIEYCRKAGLMAFKGGGKDSNPRIATPPEFRDLLISMAKMAGSPMTHPQQIPQLIGTAILEGGQ